MSNTSQYFSVQKSAGVLNYSNRGKVRVQGPDHLRFLQSMISQDLKGLAEFKGCYSTFLTHNGKLVCDFYCYKFRDYILIDVVPDMAPKLIESLNRFVVMDEVEFLDESRSWDHISLQGPMAAIILQDLFVDSLPTERYEIRKVPSHQIYLIHKAELYEEGYELLLPRGGAEEFILNVLEKFECQGVLEVEKETHNILRLELGTPWFGVDMDESNYPMEAGLEESISFTKGCFVGQEVVAKATHIGGVRRRLGKLIFPSGSNIPMKGSKVIKKGKHVGSITSAIKSIRLQQPIALAYLVQSRVSIGDEVTVPVKGENISAHIVNSF